MIPIDQCNKVILFGGSFDPPHHAHVELPTAVMRSIGADAVIYIPSGRSPFKLRRNVTPVHHRLGMLQSALKGVPNVQVLTDEIHRAQTAGNQEATTVAPSDPQPTYTVDTLQALRDRIGPTVQMRLLIGGDHLRVFDRWHQPRRIIQLAEPLVMVRPPDTPHRLLTQLPEGYDPIEWATRLVDVPQIDVSSSQIRRLVTQGQPISHLVPPAVEAYIHQHRLYR